MYGLKTRLITLIPDSVIEWLQRIRYWLLSSVFAKTRFMTSLYYTLLSDAFKREQYGVLHGRLKYLQEECFPKGSSYALRRNIHRLEKSLMMHPIREIFAESYIEEIIDYYLESVGCGFTPEENEELAWANDVLDAYFSKVGSSPIIEKAREKFLRVKHRSLPIKHIPYKCGPQSGLIVDYDGMMDLAIKRKSVRKFQFKKIPREVIDRAVDIARQSPSACNRQPFEFRIYDDPKLVKEISSLPLGMTGFNGPVPAIVVVIGHLRAFQSERDRHLIYIDSSIAAMSFIYALEVQGVSSCPINWADVDYLQERMTQVLRLALDECVVVLIAIGYADPDGLVAFSQKKPIELIRSYNYQ